MPFGLWLRTATHTHIYMITTCRGPWHALHGHAHCRHTHAPQKGAFIAPAQAAFADLCNTRIATTVVLLGTRTVLDRCRAMVAHGEILRKPSKHMACITAGAHVVPKLHQICDAAPFAGAHAEAGCTIGAAIHHYHYH